jgi:hypothetical protein
MKQTDNLPGYGFGITLIVVGVAAAALGLNITLGVASIVIGIILICARFFQYRKRFKHELEICANIEYNIKGINLCGLDDSYLGDITGTARTLKSNEYDRYAIGIYVGGKRIGYIPRGNRALYTKIKSVGGCADVEGYISKSTDENGRQFYYGKVNVLV